MFAPAAAPPRGRTPRSWWRCALVLPITVSILVLLLTPSRLQAQQTALFDVSAYVPQPILVGAPQSLGFGRLHPGASRTVAHDAAAGRSGRWSITGAACGLVDLHLTLPASLTGAGGELLIEGWTADWTGGHAAPQSFTPSAAAVRAQFDHAGAACGGSGGPWTENGTIAVRVGGTVRAAPDQASGLYTGTVTLQVSYVDF